MKKSLKVLCLMFCIMISFSCAVFAAPESDVTTEPVVTEVMEFISEDPNTPVNIKFLEKEITEGEGEEAKVIKVLTVFDGETELFPVEGPEFDLFLSNMSESIRADALKGFEALKNTSVTLDHIKLDKWGEFLNKYYGKTISDFPVGKISIKFDNYNLLIENNEKAKDVVSNKIIPTLLKPIEELSVNYPVYKYALDIQSGSLLKDYVCDLSSVRLVDTLLPFENVTEYMFFNAGSYYGMSLSKDYVAILRGYIEGNSQGYDRPVEGEYPGCVNVLAYITLIKDVSNNTLNDKVLSDFMMYKDLAIALDTKELVDTTDMTTQNKVLYFSDYKLNPDNLILAPISNDVVIIQPTYLECFRYAGYERNFGRTIDITPFVSEGADYFNVSDSKGTSKVKVSCFTETDNRLDTELGNAPFLMYYTNYVPYDLLIDWAYNKAGTSFADDSARDAFVSQIKKEMIDQGRKNDYNAYMKAAGQMTDTTRTILIVVAFLVVIIAVVVVILVVRNKKKKQEQMAMQPGNQGLLFSSEDEDDGDDDDFDGGFELK